MPKLITIEIPDDEVARIDRFIATQGKIVVVDGVRTVVPMYADANEYVGALVAEAERRLRKLLPTEEEKQEAATRTAEPPAKSRVVEVVDVAPEPAPVIDEEFVPPQR